MVTSAFAWPNGKRIAVTVTVLLETWSDGNAAPYSIQTTALKPGFVDHSGIAWGQYGGNEGIWRIMRILDRFGVPGTFCPNAQSAKLYEKAIRQAINPAMKSPAMAIFRISSWSIWRPVPSRH